VVVSAAKASIAKPASGEKAVVATKAKEAPAAAKVAKPVAGKVVAK